MDNPEENTFVAGFLRMFKAFTAAVKNYGDCGIYAEKISKWDQTKLFTQWIDIAEPMRCRFQVLNHGDAWLNNMMFKSDEQGNPLDVSLIDFQGPFWGSPANDILYFLISSVADDIKIDHFDDFIEFYHDQLTTALKKLNYDQHIPTLPELHVDLLEKGAFGKFIIILDSFVYIFHFLAGSCIMFILFVVKYDSPEEINMEVMMGAEDPEMMHRIYNNECYKKGLKLWLPFLNKRGFLDTMIKSEEPVIEKKEEC
jgi:thiamine kinase-like enzyme